ncbi:DUF1778 domain-containing protein [Xenorhabdus budapestensis]|uniref:type II toxin-antitoxin system TacA family antitoxin n=1 Tax=Xenorhabdus budapestensis TaxID=290110 RepID=UPI003A8B54D1
MQEMIIRLRQIKIVPVIAIEEARDIIPLGHALADNGLPVAEMSIYSKRKEIHLVAQTSLEKQEIIQRTADYSGATFSQFLIEAAMDRAKNVNVIERTETLQLSMAGANALFAALENPPKTNEKLIKAAKNHNNVMDIYDNGRNNSTT